MTKLEQIQMLANAIVDIQLKCLSEKCRTPSATEIATALYEMGWLHANTIITQDAACTAVDAVFRGAVLRLAEKLKQCSHCDNCFKDGKWHRYVFVEDIDEMAKRFLESET